MTPVESDSSARESLLRTFCLYLDETRQQGSSGQSFMAPTKVIYKIQIKLEEKVAKTSPLLYATSSRASPTSMCEGQRTNFAKERDLSGGNGKIVVTIIFSWSFEILGCKMSLNQQKFVFLSTQ